MLFHSNPSSQKPTLSSFLSPSRHSRRSKITFSTPACTSPTTRQILSTPTSDQLGPTDTWRNKRLPSTLLSHLTEPVLPRGEQLFTQDCDCLYNLIQYLQNHLIHVFISLSEPDVRKLRKIQLYCTAQSTKLHEHISNLMTFFYDFWKKYAAVDTCQCNIY